MSLYLALYALLAVAGSVSLSRQASLVVSVLLGLGLWLFMGTRFATGCDFYGYLVRFETLYEGVDASAFYSSEEPGFHLLNVLIKELGLGYVWLNVAASLIYLVCVFRFSRLSPRPLLLVALFFPILIVQLGMSGLRQALAVGFLLLAFVQFVEKRKLRTAIWVVIAAQFHTSAYVFLPIALLAGTQVSVWRICAALMVLGPVAALFLDERIQVYSDRYVEQIYGESSSSGALFRYAVVLLPAIAFEMYKTRVRRVFPETYDLSRLFSLMTFALIPVALVSTVALHRFVYYVQPVSLLMFINVAMVLPRRGRASRQLLFIPALVLGLYMLGWFGMSRHADYCYVPYQSYLFNDEAL
jgi:hypothetical protein